jgi:sulfate adenylyltransferase subunit 2
MRHLRDLEAQSINILREAYDHLDLALAWSKEKESTVLLWLARKAFNGQVPIPLIRINARYDSPELIQYQDRLCRDWRIGQVVRQTTSALAIWEDPPHGRDTRWGISKIEMIEEALKNHCWMGVILDTWRDTTHTPTNAHYFSLCHISSEWDLRAQQPEAWDPHRRSIPDESYVRVQPLLDWTESDIQDYIEREHVPVPKPYLDHENILRLRNLAWTPSTRARPSYVSPTP